MNAPRRCSIRWTATICVIVLLATTSLPAATIHVSTAGNDANTGLTWPTAKRTVQAGLNAAVAGDQVWVAAGTYAGCITLKAGVALYGGFADGQTDLSQRDWIANVTVLDGNKSGSVVTSPSAVAESTRIDGFTIRNGSGTLVVSDRYGGGIYCFTPVTVANNTLTGNSATYGGGICCSHSATINNNTVRGNSGSYGAGIYCKDGTQSITGNTIAGNDAAFYGGGVYCQYPASTTIAGNLIKGNRCGSTGSGGGIYCGALTRILNNTITGNVASSGAGIRCGGIGSPVIAGNTITGNNANAFEGGGIYCHTIGEATITGNTITGNTARGGGGAVHYYGYYSSDRLTISNTIIAFNSSGIHNRPLGTIALRHNCVFGNAEFDYLGLEDPAGSDGNISVDPKLASLAYGNVHIQPGSPCADSGDDAAVQAGWTDIDGQARIGGTGVDIGADESDGTAWPEVPQTIVRVSPTGDDGNDGSTWGLAKRTVQAGIDAASEAGGDVWVQEGTYLERIRLKGFTHVYGGFAGSETQREERNWSVHKTILDAFPGGSVVTASEIGHNVSTIDGFTIRNGMNSQGGGISCSCAITIANNTITRNRAFFSYSPMGGGIYCSAAGTTIVNSTISGNSATGLWDGGLGGGVYCASRKLTIVNSTIAGNDASTGGGIYCQSTATIANTIIAMNSSGIYVYSTSSDSPALRHNCVFGNGAHNYVGLADPSGADGNIAVDPKLADLVHGNVHIQPGSPCVDAGDDGAVEAGWRDIDGQARTIGSHVDIGADEADGTVWPLQQDPIIRVSLAGDDANNGSSWALAKRTVQAGIDAAAASGGEVWVREGTYAERITLRRDVHVYGGFAGNETQRSQRDWSGHVTILDGGQGGSVVTATKPGYRLSTIDGFTIRNGLMYGGDHAGGGGIYCYGSSPTIANNTVENNSTPDNWSGAGGIACELSSPLITNNVIRNNYATAVSGSSRLGGGIYCNGSSATIVNNTITGNTAREGGGISCYGSSYPLIAGNTIAGNVTTQTPYGYSGYGGGIYCDNSSPTMTGNTVQGNTARTGGGVCLRSSNPALLAATVTGNKILGNMAVSDEGGGIYCWAVSPAITNNSIAGNSAADAGGGGICIRGLDAKYTVTPMIAGNTIAGNYGRYGGAIHCVNASPTITNTIMAFNSSGISGGGTAILRYNCVYSNTGYNYIGMNDPTGTNGNISADPQFVAASEGADGLWGTADDVYGDLRLLPWSPCVDAGNNADVPTDAADLDGDGDTAEPLPVDLAGAARFLDDPQVADTGAGTSPIVDMGAYERGRPISDVDGDWLTDVVDLLYLVDSFGKSQGDDGFDPRCDFNSDGVVDAVDLLDLVHNFGK